MARAMHRRTANPRGKRDLHRGDHERARPSAGGALGEGGGPQRELGTVEVFVCARKQGVRIRYEACGERHLAACAEGRPGVMRLDDETCRACSIGAAHERGERPARWPDGEPIVTIALKPLGTLHLE